MDQQKLVKKFIIGTFVALYALVSVISTIHVIDFFELSNPYWLAVTLAIGFELGAAASLASLVILDKTNKTLVWALFITITLMQMQGNMYYAFTNLTDFSSWSELFDLIEEEVIYQKRILAFVSGAILPLVALGFIKSLVDYIKPEEDLEGDDFTPEESSFSEITEEQLAQAEQDLDDYRKEMLSEEDESEFVDYGDPEVDAELEDWESTLNDGLEDDEYYFEDFESYIREEEPLEGVEQEESYEESELDEPREEPTQSEEIEDDEDLLERAKRRVAEKNMQQFLKDKQDGTGDSV